MMLSVDEATARILSAFERLGTEQVGLENALGRVLSVPVSARLTQPAKAVSAMDGYAVRGADMTGADMTATEVRLRLIAEVAAGHAPDRPVGAGVEARIVTGAIRPDGRDSQGQPGKRTK
ncbi:MAG: molybdopterin molybdenumtransferase MoeA, partial [Dongiaceae bacterium]